MTRRGWMAAGLLACAALPAQAGTLELVAGSGEGGPGSPATQAKLVVPFGVAFDPQGRLVIAEYDGHHVWRVDEQGRLQPLAGTGKKGRDGDGGPATLGSFDGIHNLAIDRAGNIYIADTWNALVRRIDPVTGLLSTFAGTGVKESGGDGGPAHAASFSDTFCVTLDPPAENLYITELKSRRIRKIHLATQVIHTVAGNGEKGVPQAGTPATTSPLFNPRATATDARGNLYILDRDGHALYRVDPEGRIVPTAGTGQSGMNLDTVPALQAQFNGPKHLCAHPDGRIFIADAENHLIRCYDPETGTVSRVAGTGKKGLGPAGGDPLQTALSRPHGVTIGPDGLLYIVDSYNHRVLRMPLNP